MTDNVIEIGQKPPPLIFVCNCGCSSFSLMSDGSTECSACGTVDADQVGAWAEGAPTSPDFDGDPFADVQGNKSVEFAKARIGRLASDDDAALVLIAKDGGAVHAWCKAETAEQMEWMREKLSIGGDLIENTNKARQGSE